jgi:hypothetical protein
VIEQLYHFIGQCWPADSLALAARLQLPRVATGEIVASNRDHLPSTMSTVGFIRKDVNRTARLPKVSLLLRCAFVVGPNLFLALLDAAPELVFID